MQTAKQVVLCAGIIVLLTINQACAADIEWVDIVNPGGVSSPNTADTTGYGSVGYDYRIGKYEVTNAQYVEFLNAVATTDSYGLYNTGMGNYRGGITQSGDAGDYTYSVKTVSNDSGVYYQNRPVTFVSFYNALRFANWLHNGKPVGAQDATTTEDGAYTFDSQTHKYLGATHNAEAVYWLPTEDEWYKAAYYNPVAEGYYDYPTGSDTAPTAELPSDGENSANYSYVVYSQGTDETVTNVGAYYNSGSPYGTFDQGGNLLEWNESLVGTDRCWRGSSWSGYASHMIASSRYSLYPEYGGDSLGFRLASLYTESGGDVIPEPISVGLLITGLIALAIRTREKA